MIRIKSQRGFTLMELIGVMAIIGILAATVAPGIIDSIDRAYGTAEEENLRALADAFEHHVRDNKNIPGPAPASWSAAISAYADLPQTEVQLNSRGYRRQVYVDPLFFSTTATPFTGYTQAAGLNSRPNSPRLMLLSDLAGNLPSAPTSGTAFSDIWDQTAAAAVVEGPKLKIERLNLAGSFHRVLLSNASLQQPAYVLEGSAAFPVPGAVGATDGTLTRYVLVTTRLQLHFSPYPSGAMNTATIVSEDIALRYLSDGSNWYWERP